MTNFNSKKFKHLTLDDRIEIQQSLNQGVTFKAITTSLGKDQTTISKEVKRHISVSPSDTNKFNKNGNPIVTICPKLLKAPFVCNPCKKRHGQCGFKNQLYNVKAAHNSHFNDIFCLFHYVLEFFSYLLPLTFQGYCYFLLL